METIGPKKYTRYPIGIQNFSEMRRLNAVYVDKTDLIYDLTDKYKYVFISRPRRFGKSLLSSTLQYYFEGRKDLFEGLAIEQLEKDWIQYPVLHFDLSTAKNQDLEGIISEINVQLIKYEKLYGRDAAEDSFGKRLNGLIERASEQTGQKAVVIIDEYDAAMLDVLHKEKELEQVRVMMQEFFAPLKKCDPYLRFVFITGITKFSQLSIFSVMNNMKKISMLDEYSAICGITETELHEYFHDEVAKIAQKWCCTTEQAFSQLKEHYDGYHFSENSEDIYNPFSLLNALCDKSLNSYWFETATPTYLVRQLKYFNTDITTLEAVEALPSSFDAPTEGMTSALPLLYQSGYLTIKSYNSRKKKYVLGIPNQEVRVGLAENLLPAYTNLPKDETQSILTDFCDAVMQDDMDGALRLMQSYLASVPYTDGGKDMLENDEKSEYYYARMFFIMFSFLNYNVHTEVRTARGRADAVMYTDNAIYVIELKVNRSAQEALDQIDMKDYALAFKADGRKVVKVGISFSTEKRTIQDWIISEV